MSQKAWTLLIGAKIICCGALLLVLTGVVSLGGIAALVTGNTLPIAGGGMIALIAAGTYFRSRSRRSHPERDGAEGEARPARRPASAADA